jgi:hypothetical protein
MAVEQSSQSAMLQSSGYANAKTTDTTEMTDIMTDTAEMTDIMTDTADTAEMTDIIMADTVDKRI